MILAIPPNRPLEADDCTAAVAAAVAAPLTVDDEDADNVDDGGDCLDRDEEEEEEVDASALATRELEIPLVTIYETF